MINFLDLKKITEEHSEEIENAIVNVARSGWYLQGEANKSFEKHYSSYIGADYTIGCANGLDALIWIYRAYISLEL